MKRVVGEVKPNNSAYDLLRNHVAPEQRINMVDNGKILKKAKPGSYVWMVKAKHGVYVHPSLVSDREKQGYKRKKKA